MWLFNRDNLEEDTLEKEKERFYRENRNYYVEYHDADDCVEKHHTNSSNDKNVYKDNINEETINIEKERQRKIVKVFGITLLIIYVMLFLLVSDLTAGFVIASVIIIGLVTGYFKGTKKK